jgi:hypothetical protein
MHAEHAEAPAEEHSTTQQELHLIAMSYRNKEGRVHARVFMMILLILINWIY